MSKHTPGPWIYDRDSGEVSLDDGEVFPAVAFVNRELVDPAQADADGNLIAAAPEMLKALKKIERYASAMFERSKTTREAQEAHLLQDAARTGIAKAEGRRP